MSTPTEPRLAKQKIIFGDLFPGRNYVRPLPPLFGQKTFLRGGGGVYILNPPPRQDFIRPPSFIRPPPLAGYFQGLGGGGISNLAPHYLRSS